MKNFVQAGNRMVVVAAAAIVSGDAVLQGSLFGVAETSAAIGEETVLVMTGVFELPKAAVAIAQGAAIYWDNAAKKVTTASAGNTLVGAAFNATIAGDALAQVRIG
jgi:predicted RecA/RadA family phage recombinase